MQVSPPLIFFEARICVVSKEHFRVSQTLCLAYHILALCAGSSDSSLLINNRTPANTAEHRGCFSFTGLAELAKINANSRSAERQTASCASEGYVHYLHTPLQKEKKKKGLESLLPQNALK